MIGYGGIDKYYGQTGSSDLKDSRDRKENPLYHDKQEEVRI